MNGSALYGCYLLRAILNKPGKEISIESKIPAGDPMLQFAF
jgi:hypothetical protein